MPFTLTELADSINKPCNRAVNPDEIHSEFRKQMPSELIKYILNVFNNIMDIWHLPRKMETGDNCPHFKNQ